MVRDRLRPLLGLSQLVVQRCAGVNTGGGSSVAMRIERLQFALVSDCPSGCGSEIESGAEFGKEIINNNHDDDDYLVAASYYGIPLVYHSVAAKQ